MKYLINLFFRKFIQENELSFLKTVKEKNKFFKRLNNFKNSKIAFQKFVNMNARGSVKLQVDPLYTKVTASDNCCWKFEFNLSTLIGTMEDIDDDGCSFNDTYRFRYAIEKNKIVPVKRHR